LEEKERKERAFGLYVAGRMQKAALRPLFKGSKEQQEEVRKRNNTGTNRWSLVALGLQEQTFSFDELVYRICFIKLSC